MNTGETGLAFIPILVGVLIALFIFLYWDGVLQRARQRDAHWTFIEEYRRLPLACLGGAKAIQSVIRCAQILNLDKDLSILSRFFGLAGVLQLMCIGLCQC